MRFDIRQRLWCGSKEKNASEGETFADKSASWITTSAARVSPRGLAGGGVRHVWEGRADQIDGERQTDGEDKAEDTSSAARMQG